MNAFRISTLVQRIRTRRLGTRQVSCAGLHRPFVLMSEAPPPVEWNPPSFEATLRTAPTRELAALWAEAGGLRLFVDMTYGQWGLVIWSPSEALAQNGIVRSRRARDMRSGDLVIGQFVGDSDLVVLRCDGSSADYASVVIALPIDPREAWQTVAVSLFDFLNRFCEAGGEKYWEKQEP